MQNTTQRCALFSMNNQGAIFKFTQGVLPNFKQYILTLSLIFISVCVNALTVTSGQNLEVDGASLGNMSELYVESGGKITITGDVEFMILDIEYGGTVIIEGNLDIDAKNDGYLVNNGSLIITGDLLFRGGNSTQLVIEIDGVLVVGGNYSIPGGREDINNGDNFYLSNPSDSDISNGGLEDAIDSGVIPPELEDIFDEIVIGDYIWTGNNSSDWDDPLNWEEGVNAPSSTQFLQIESVAADKFPLILKEGDNVGKIRIESGGIQVDTSANLTISGLTINGGTVTINEGVQLTVENNIDGNTDGLIINSSTDFPTAVFVKGDVSSTVTVNQTFPSRRYWYISHCVSGVTMSDYTTSFDTPNDFFLYNYEDEWLEIQDSASFQFDDEMEGYSLIIKDDATLSYSGVLNNEPSYERDLLANTESLVGNPYPCYIDLLGGDIDLGDAEGDVYIRTTLDNGERGFETYNVSAGITVPEGNRYVAPGQSFWVHTNADPATVTIYREARTATHDGAALKSVGGDSDLFRVQMHNKFGSDETVVAFRENGTEFYTNNDSPKKYTGSNVPNIYSLKDEKAITISLLPELTEDIVIPLGIEVSSEGLQESTLKFSSISSLLTDCELILVDKLLGVNTIIDGSIEYIFDVYKEKDNDRFEMLVNKKSDGTPTDMEDDLEVIEPKIYAVNNHCFVTIPSEMMIEEDIVLGVYNMSGNLLQQFNVTELKTQFELSASNQILIVKLRVGDKQYNQKIASY